MKLWDKATPFKRSNLPIVADDETSKFMIEFESIQSKRSETIHRCV